MKNLTFLLAVIFALSSVMPLYADPAPPQEDQTPPIPTMPAMDGANQPIPPSENEELSAAFEQASGMPKKGDGVISPAVVDEEKPKTPDVKALQKDLDNNIKEWKEEGLNEEQIRKKIEEWRNKQREENPDFYISALLGKVTVTAKPPEKKGPPGADSKTDHQRHLDKNKEITDYEKERVKSKDPLTADEKKELARIKKIKDPDLQEEAFEEFKEKREFQELREKYQVSDLEINDARLKIKRYTETLPELADPEIIDAIRKAAERLFLDFLRAVKAGQFKTVADVRKWREDKKKELAREFEKLLGKGKKELATSLAELIVESIYVALIKDGDIAGKLQEKDLSWRHIDETDPLTGKRRIGLTQDPPKLK